MTKVYAYGIARPDQVSGLTGREMLQAIVDGRLPQAPISQTLGFWLVEVGEGQAVFEGEPAPALLNPMGTIHGGWALTLIDSAAACAGHSLLGVGQGYTTIETRGNFSRPILRNSGRVRCEARVINAGRQVITCDARVLDRDGRLLGHGSSTLMVLAAPS